MKRYALFSGASYEAQGGWDDLDTLCDSIEECKQAHFEIFEYFSGDWAQIVDLQEGKCVLVWNFKAGWYEPSD